MGKLAAISLDSARAALKSQYRAGLAMLTEAVESCPDELWTADQHGKAFWQIAYHALYFTHLYLQPRSSDFLPWPGHQGDVQHEDGIPGPPDPASGLPLMPEPYSRHEVMEYVSYLEALVGPTVDGLDLASPESGFHWYPVSKLEHQIINVRHLHHHVAQLADRLRAATGRGVRWVGRA